MSKNTAYMSRADVIVLMTAHCAASMLDAHGGSEGVPKRIVDFATQVADELVTRGVVEAPESDTDEDKGGPFTDFRVSDDDDDFEVDVEEDIDPDPHDTPPAPALVETPAADVGTSGEQNQS